MRTFLLSLSLVLSTTCSAQLTEKNREQLRSELITQINELRTSLGLKSLVVSDTLRKAAEFHSDYMAKNNTLSHDQKSKKYKTPKKRVNAFKGKDFEIVGENVLYSTKQNFPLNKKEVSQLASEMFESWKNSPGHYANMTEPEYVFGDLGFKTSSTKSVVYATHVFGKRGHVIPNQLSPNAFKILPASPACEQAYKGISNIVMNMGDDFEIEDDEVNFYYHDINYFKRIFSGPNDGLAIDLIHKDQLACGKPNELDVSPIYDGVMLKPVFRDEMLRNNRAESDYRLITKVGDLPKNLSSDDYSPSVIMIKNGEACLYLYPAQISRNDYTLRPIEPITNDEPSAQLQKKGVVAFQQLQYNFNTNKRSSPELPTINNYEAPIHSIRITSFSSVEGDSSANAKLHNARADYIRRHVSQKLTFQDSLLEVDASENWTMMDFQLNYLKRDDLSALSHDSLKAILKDRDDSLPWDSLLFEQRISSAVIYYEGEYDETTSTESLASFNLRTAVALKNPILANKALYELYKDEYTELSLLFEKPVFEYLCSESRTVANFAALLSHIYYESPYQVTQFIHGWLHRKDELSESARFNLIHLYTLVGTHLLDNWDVSAERLSNVIHPHKINPLSPTKEDEQLILNTHLTFIQYFGQINDGENISKSFYFIADYFKEHALDMEDDVDLSLFFNNWSMYRMTEKHLLPKFVDNALNEDGLFILAETMNYIHSKDQTNQYIHVHEKALEMNKSRWCNWLKKDFQVLRDYRVKRLYCEACE